MDVDFIASFNGNSRNGDSDVGACDLARAVSREVRFGDNVSRVVKGPLRRALRSDLEVDGWQDGSGEVNRSRDEDNASRDGNDEAGDRISG